MKDSKSRRPIIDTMQLYRMPWSFSDNPFSWMEPTRNCNLACEYCYQEHDRNSNKTLEIFESELLSILAVKRCDTINKAGGEPLFHPQIHQIVTLVRSYGLKPHLITNGVTLTPELLRSLKAAGVAGITFHVGALQRRPGYRDADEIKLNELRQHYADMVHDAGGLVCGFTTTIVPSMVHQSGSIVAWTLRNSDRVVTHMLIPVRLARAPICLSARRDALSSRAGGSGDASRLVHIFAGHAAKSSKGLQAAELPDNHSNAASGYAREWRSGPVRWMPE